MNHQIVQPSFDIRHTGDVSIEAADTYIRAALSRMKADRAAGMASLDDMFRSGRPPASMSGRYAGELLAVDLAPGVTQYIEFVQSRFRPWRGKTFDPAAAAGDNIFDKSARPWFRFLMPFYRRYRADSATLFHAFRFRTYVAPALTDRDVAVLKIDYNSSENPALTIRRVLDELVELGDGYYLGRAYVRWWWGAWQRVAYFSLRMNTN